MCFKYVICCISNILKILIFTLIQTLIKKIYLFDVYVTVHHSYTNINSQLDVTIRDFVDNYDQSNNKKCTLVFM